MSLEVDATYENGVLKLDRPLPLEDRTRVRVIVQGQGGRTRRAYGLLRWTGDPKELERLALDPEFGIEGSP
jgi:predicted DNA-binding antitoxin AbrB/MazE fold protein